MKTDKASKTAQYMALFRAIETARPQGSSLFKDPYAIRFLDRTLRLVAALSSLPIGRDFIPRLVEKEAPGALASGVARTKYIDDLLEKSVRAGARQVVILGAGFDMRALRCDFLKSSAIIEIDHPDTSRFKLRRLTRETRMLRARVSYYEADFNRQSLEEIGAASTIDYTVPTAILWEGVTSYLTSDAVDATFRWSENFPRVDLIFTYLDKRVLDHPEEFFGSQRTIRYLEENEEQWTFGFALEELPSYLKKYGLTLVEESGAADYRARYMADRPGLPAYEFHRVAWARR